MPEKKYDGILNKIVLIDGDLKKLIIDYIGEKTQPENGDITLEMVISQIASEFPEILITIAEENYLKGYEQGLNDTSILNLDN